MALQLPRSRPAVQAIAPLRWARNAVSPNDARGAAHAGVEGAAAAEVAAPRDRLVGAADVGAVAGRRVDRVVAGERVDLARRALGPLVPGVGAVLLQQVDVAGGGVHLVAVDDGLLGLVGRAVRRRPRADQAVEERGVGLGLRGAADAEEAAAVRDERLDRGLLLELEQIAGRVEEDERARLGERVAGDVGGRVEHLDGEVALLRELRDRGDPGLGGGVGDLAREDQQLALRRPAPAPAPPTNSASPSMSAPQASSARSDAFLVPAASRIPLPPPSITGSPVSRMSLPACIAASPTPQEDRGLVRRLAEAQRQPRVDALARAGERPAHRPARPQPHRRAPLVAAAHRPLGEHAAARGRAGAPSRGRPAAPACRDRRPGR